LVIFKEKFNTLKKYRDKFITWLRPPSDPDPGPPTVTIKGETWSPAPLGLEETLRLLMILGPSIGLIEDVWPDFQRALKTTDGSRPRLLQAIMVSLADQMEPAAITQAFVILLGKEPEWFRGVRAVELVDALPILEEIHSLWDLIEAARRLGVVVRYEK